MTDEHSHVMGGSNAKRRRNCYGSLKREQAIPDPESSADADQGSCLHAAQALIVTENPQDMKSAEPLFDELIGQDMGFPGHEITPELVQNKLKPATEAWIRIRDNYGLIDWWIEQRVSLETVIPGAFGTTDLIAMDIKNRFHCLDWKFGDGVVVDVVENDGNAFYVASSFYDDDPEMQEFCAEVTSIFFHIVQPRVGDSQVIKTWETDENWIEKWIDQSVKAMEEAQKPDAPTKPGDWCRWCKAKAVCPSYAQLASDALSKQPDSMSAVELSHALQQAELLKHWIGEVYKLAQRELETGAAIPGYKLVQKQPRRQWMNSEEAEARLKRARLKVDQMYQKKLISPPQLEKLRPNLYSKIADEYVILASSGFTVAPDSDKREAITSGVELLANALPDPKTLATGT